MQLVEVMVAAAVFTAASGGSLQLFAQAASSSQQGELRQQRIERIELDRLQLQAYWRRAVEAADSCAVSSEQLREMAASVPAPPQLQREVLLGEEPDELRLRWRFAGESVVVRERLVTTAGLGTACTVDEPLTDSQVEGLP
ncbi:MAG: hypothetical protein RLZZ247_1297 [Cyanobacteriota bacterium]|jgi:hypothetical protein